MYSLSHRERKVLVRVLPNDGYNFEAEIKKGTSIKDVIKNIKELCLLYEIKESQHTDIESFQKICDSFMILSEKYGTIIRTSNGFYREWLKLGFDLMDAKRQGYEENSLSSTSPLNQASNYVDSSEPALNLDVLETALEKETPVEETNSDYCKFCRVFQGLGTMVCPQCGSSLNPPSAHD